MALTRRILGAWAPACASVPGRLGPMEGTIHTRAAVDRAKTVRLFDSDFLEWFTRARPKALAAFWIPVSLTLLIAGLNIGRFGPGVLGLSLIAVLLLWSLFEYLFHRVLFHVIADLPGGRRLAYVMHGCHHDDPADATRNVMPLVVTIPIFAGFFSAFAVFFPLPLCLVLFGLFGFAYLTYDLTHYACHQRPMRGPIGRYLKRHHLLHHFADSSRNFGVTSPLWDRLLGTLKA
jgi:sterol desaturase/sphingolipid hydroxylase (fatty acid hydroxylase superfamily)